MAKISATEIRNGTLIEWEGRLWRVVKARHVHVGGRGGAYMQIEAKDIKSDSKNNIRLRTDEKIERPFLEQREMRFLYPDGDGYVFMDEESFEQLTLSNDLFEEKEGFLLPDTLISVSLYEERIVGIVLPQSVIFDVVNTEPQAKGATASSSYKPATVNTGITVMVPPFVNIGEKIRVNVESGEYLERVN